MKLLISLDQESPLGLQLQIRQKMVAAILSGAMPVGERIISSRKLSEELKVARNTVVLAYNQLIDEGYLISYERKGLFVNEKILPDYNLAIGSNKPPVLDSEAFPDKEFWQQKIKVNTTDENQFNCPDEWFNHPYPFIDGVFDTSLFPVKQWQEASRLSLSNINTQRMASNPVDDDPRLIEEIRTKILPRRGITAQAQEILITSGSQHALYLLANLLTNSETKIAMEEPGATALRSSLRLTGSHIHAQKIDQHGMLVNAQLHDCQLICVTPSHQNPTAVTMPIQRRQELIEFAKKHDQIIIEDDSESERNYFGNPKPALRSMDEEGRVIYVSALPKAIAPGLELGFIVASPELIKQARRLRYLMFGNTNKSVQRTAAFFLFLGYYDAFMLKVNKIFQQRWYALRDALNHYLPNSILTIPNQGGTAFWVKCPEYISMQELLSQAAKQGILIEPVKDYYYRKQNYQACFRLGVTSIDESKIREGIAKLAKLIREYSNTQISTLDGHHLKPLTQKQLFKKLAGATLICQTVYGEPCSIDIRADGKLIGLAGENKDDRDKGRWWIEEGCWFRQWQHWSYAEQAGFFVTIEDHQINWFNQNGRLVDTAIIHFADLKSNNHKLA